MDYSKLSPLLIEAVKALVEENKMLKAEVKEMKIVQNVMNSRLDQIEALLRTSISNEQKSER